MCNRVVLVGLLLVVVLMTPLARSTVFLIDAGHGGPGASKFGPNGDGKGSHGPEPDPLSEEWVNLQVALKVYYYADIDRWWCAYAKMTRDAETTAVSLEDRVQFAKDESADYFLSIHHNGSSDPAVQGTEVFWSDSSFATWKTGNQVDSNFIRNTPSRDSVFAMKVLMRLLNAWGYTNRCASRCGRTDCMRGCDESHHGVGHLFLLNHTHTCYCALSEASFITSPSEEWEFLNGTAHLDREAWALYTGGRSHYYQAGIAQISYRYVGGSDGEVWVDLLPFQSPIQFCWEVGESHQLDAFSSLLVGQNVYTFHHWAHLDPIFQDPWGGYPIWYTTTATITVPQESPYHIYRAYFSGGPYWCTLYEPNLPGTFYAIGAGVWIGYTCSAGVDSTTLLDFSLDRNNGGDGFPELLAQNVPFADGFCWSVNAPESDSCLLKIVARDIAGNRDSSISEFTFSVSACSTCGDANGDGTYDNSDAVFLIQWIFVPGSPPPGWCRYPYGLGDANGDGSADITDAVYLINYIFVPGSPAPHCGGFKELEANSRVVLRGKSP